MLAINPSLQYQENITTTNASNLTNAGDYASLAQVFLEHVKPKHINKLIGWQFNKVLRESAINREIIGEFYQKSTIPIPTWIYKSIRLYLYLWGWQSTATNFL